MVMSSFIDLPPIVLSMVMSSFMFVIVLVRKDMDVKDRMDHPTLHSDTN
jgi:hypothetical protein